MRLLYFERMEYFPREGVTWCAKSLDKWYNVSIVMGLYLLNPKLVFVLEAYFIWFQSGTGRMGFSASYSPWKGPYFDPIWVQLARDKKGRATDRKDWYVDHTSTSGPIGCKPYEHCQCATEHWATKAKRTAREKKRKKLSNQSSTCALISQASRSGRNVLGFARFETWPILC